MLSLARNRISCEKSESLRHAPLIDASEDGPLDILIMAQIALDDLPQKL